MKKMKKPIVWTEAHQREALRRFREMTALCDGDIDKLGELDEDARAGGESGFRSAVRQLDRSLSGARIDREVRRVDRLARGVDIRETETRFAIRTNDGERIGIGSSLNTWNDARAWCTNRGERPVRVTVRRVRRAP